MAPAHPSSLLDALLDISLSFHTLFLPGKSRFNLSALGGLGMFKQLQLGEGKQPRKFPARRMLVC